MEKTHIQYVRQPKFYKDFHCIGGSCPVSCCQKWGIDYTIPDVEKLKNANCSDYLKNLIDSSFVPFRDRLKITLKEDGNCPFHNEEGLCAIQKELGEEYLSLTCRDYPRKAFEVGNYALRTCTISCPRVLSLICNNDDSLELENIPAKKRNITYVYCDSKLDLLNHPELKYRAELFDFFYEILSDKNRCIETSITLAAIAAQKLDEFVKQGKHDIIPTVIKSLKPQLNNTVQIAKLEEAKPNLSLKANFSAGLLKSVANANIYINIFENGIPSVEKYNKGMEIFQQQFNGSPNFIQNISLNLFIMNKMPCKDINYSFFENMCYYAAEIAVIKFLVPAVAIKYEAAYNKVVEAIAYIDRSFTHNDHNVKKVLDYMKAFKCTTPAYLLGIIK